MQNQLNKFEELGVLVSRKEGTARLFYFKRSPVSDSLRQFLKDMLALLPISTIEKYYRERRGPRSFAKKLQKTRVSDPMRINAMTQLSDPFRASVWLIAAYLIHLAEEWFWDFPEWSRVIRGAGVSSAEFVAINSVALLLFVVLAAIAYRPRWRPAMAWFPATLATIFSLNGVLHALATLRYDAYSPGTVTGLLISFPLGLLVLHQIRGRFSSAGFAGCLVAGVLAHVFITFVAFR